MSTKTCCLCFDLRAGCVLLGVISLTISVSWLNQDVRDYLNANGELIAIASKTIFVIADVMLFVGIFKGIKKLFIPYMIVQVFIILFCWVIFVEGVKDIRESNQYYSAIVALLVFIGMKKYFLYVVYSYSKGIKEGYPM